MEKLVISKKGKKVVLEEIFDSTKIADVDILVGNGGLVHVASSSRATAFQIDQLASSGGADFEGVHIEPQKAKKPKSRTGVMVMTH